MTMNAFTNKIVGWQPETYYIFFKSLKSTILLFWGCRVYPYNIKSQISVQCVHPPPTIRMTCVSYYREYFDFWTTKTQFVAVMHCIEYYFSAHYYNYFWKHCKWQWQIVESVMLDSLLQSYYMNTTIRYNNIIKLLYYEYIITYYKAWLFKRELINGLWDVFLATNLTRYWNTIIL